MEKTKKEDYSLDFGITAFLGNGKKVNHLYCKSFNPEDAQEKILYFKNTVIVEGEVPEETEIIIKDFDNELIEPFITKDGTRIFSSWKKIIVEVKDKQFKTVKIFKISRVKKDATTKVKVQGDFKTYLEESLSQGIFAEKLNEALSA